jgi:hypothetical protein
MVTDSSVTKMEPGSLTLSTSTRMVRTMPGSTSSTSIRKFIDHGVDAFRVDTVAYMSADFWQDFAQEMTDHARSLGNDHFYMAGEAWTGDRTAALDLIYNGGNNENFHMLDLHGSSMDFPGWMGHVFQRGARFR